MDAAFLIWSSLFSLIGMAGFMFGKRWQQILPILIGAALMFYPYFVSSTTALIGVGVLLVLCLCYAGRFENGL